MDEEPLVSVVRGTPTPEELAALTCVLAARSASPPAHSPGKALSAWTAGARPGAAGRTWRTSALPR